MTVAKPYSIFVSKKVGNQKDHFCHISLKSCKLGGLIFLFFFISNYFNNKNSQGRKFSEKKIPTYGNSALIEVLHIVSFAKIIRSFLNLYRHLMLNFAKGSKTPVHL